MVGQGVHYASVPAGASPSNLLVVDHPHTLWTCIEGMWLFAPDSHSFIRIRVGSNLVEEWEEGCNKFAIDQTSYRSIWHFDQGTCQLSGYVTTGVEDDWTSVDT